MSGEKSEYSKLRILPFLTHFSLTGGDPTFAVAKHASVSAVIFYRQPKGLQSLTEHLIL